MIPKLRFNGFSNEWDKKTLGDIGEVRMCKRVFNSETNQSGGIPFYKIGTFGKSADAFINERLYRVYREKYKFPKKGEILISASGTLGRRVRYNGEDAYYQDSNIVWIENDEELVTNDFLYYLYEIVRYDSEGGTIQRLYNSIIKRAKIGLPSFAEQNKITLLLNSIDQRIILLNKKKEALETYKKGLMQKIFSQELSFKREDGSDFPEWRLTKFLEVCLKENSGLSKGDLSDVGLNEVYGAAGNLEGFTNVPSPSSAYVSIIKDGAGVGRVKFLPPNTSTIGTLDMIIAYDELVLPYFLYILLINIRWRKYTVGSTIPHIYFRDWKTEKVQIPSLEEQRKIVKVFSDLESKCSKILQKIERTEQLKKGLLQQMFV
jgi:type I restriction enzyme, S subunit